MKRSGRYELAVALDIEGPAQIGLQRDRVIADVVAEKNREHHNVRLVGPHLLAQRHQFLRGPISVDAEVERLDAPPLEPRTLPELARRDRSKRVLVWHLDRLGIGVADNCDPYGAGRLGSDKFWTAKTAAIDFDISGALATIVASGIGPQAPSARRVIAIEVRKKTVGDSHADLGDQPRADDAEDDQHHHAQSLTNHRLSP